jgi:hypothetical protein
VIPARAAAGEGRRGRTYARGMTQQPPTPPHPVLRYTTLRIAVFIVVLGIGYAVGLRSFLLLLASLLVSGIVSFMLLSNQRDAMGGVIGRRLQRINERIDERTRAEDDDVDDAPDDVRPDVRPDLRPGHVGDGPAAPPETPRA